MTKTIDIVIKRPLEWQTRVIDEAKRFNVVCVGRRAGKTELGKILLVNSPTIQEPQAWFSPTYKDMLEVWRDMAHTLQPITTRANATERRIELMTGGVIEFWSLDNPNAGRGRKYARIIIDEGAFVKDLMNQWNMVLLPTLADYQGDAWIFSTPKGHNGFYHLWSQHKSNPAQWAAWQMPTTVNPHIADSEIEAMRGTMPERIYAQEILAQFLDDGGGVFRRVRACAGAEPQDKARPGHGYIFGVDWGKHNDFTVITVIDTTLKAVVAVDRFNQIDYSLQRGRLKALYEKFKPTAIYAEKNSIGEPNIEELRRSGLPVYPFITTNASKAKAVEDLALAFETDGISIIDDNELIGELQAFEAERLPSGMLRYGAPTGFHDDIVMSLAVAWSGIGSGWLMV